MREDRQPKHSCDRADLVASETLNIGGYDNCFDTSGFAVTEQLIQPALSQFLYSSLLDAAKKGLLAKGDSQVPDTHFGYAAPITESLLDLLTPYIQEMSGLKLFPTYSYFRVYKKGDVLPAHFDRPACEISASLTLGFDADGPWPLWVESCQQARQVHLPVGSAIVYKGCEIRHWRDVFTGNHQVQVFLHYVNQTGPFRHLRFDGRHSLNSTNPIRTIIRTLGGL